MSTAPKFEIHIVFDNRCVREGFLTGFGFSALIRNPSTNSYSLFDTGGDGNVLIHNIRQFDVNLNQIKNVVISHSHFDHSGGLSEVIKHNPNIKIYVPKDNHTTFQRRFSQQEIIGVEQEEEIEENMMTSGQIGSSIKEEALYLKNQNQEIFVIVGCTHPGLEKFIIRARKIGNVKGIVGGFHGFRKYSYLEGIEVIAACHCTSHVQAIKKRFPNHYKQICVGDTISF
ncbi:MAG: MBL fold metallo-hydrolase [Candidatus Lokiarchaeota archaeon]|nr:MBL fold metallo-hydrolase [Candidatus Lokiarchaeota archaeon]